MRLVMLYVRARGITAALLGVLVVALAVVAADSWLAVNATLLRPAPVTTIVLTSLVAAMLLAVTLGGAGDALEGTTPFPWVRWRAAHLVLLAGLAALQLGVAGRESAVLGGPGAVVRNVVGYAGLAAIAAAVGGARAGWAAPLTYALVTYAIPLIDLTSPAGRILVFHLQPGGDVMAARTAAILLAAGVLLYGFRGAREK